MMIGISTRSDAIDASRALIEARSGDPGAYERTGSLIGGGTRRMPLNGTRPGTAGAAVSVDRDGAAGRDVGAATGALMRTSDLNLDRDCCAERYPVTKR